MGSFIVDAEGYVWEGSGNRNSLHRAPNGNLQGSSFTVDFKRWMKGAQETEVSLSLSGSSARRTWRVGVGGVLY
jgi:hypothetical protein